MHASPRLFSDGLVVEFRAKQVRGQRVAGLPLGEDVSNL